MKDCGEVDFIAIRRGILQDISSIDELMAYDKRHVRVKPQHKDEFLFYHGQTKGTGHDTSAPLTTRALSEYLKSRCHKIGCTVHAIGMISIRRRAASDLMARVGPDATRKNLGPRTRLIYI